MAEVVATASANTKTELLIPARYGCLLGCLPAAERKVACLLVTVICLLVSCIREELVLGCCFFLLNTESAAHG